MLRDDAQHYRSLKALARRLVLDDSHADDVVQETALRALERPPRSFDNHDAWLARVARNFALLARRRETRLRSRERAVARPERLADVGEQLERARLEAELAAAVDALSEPYRSTIRLRFYEGLPPRKIAVAQGVGVETVRSRLKRGLERLRRALDEAYEGRERWLAAVLPWVGFEKKLLAVAVGVCLAALCAVGVALAPAAHARWFLRSSAPDALVASAPVAPATMPLDPARPVAEPAPPARSASVATEPELAAPPPKNSTLEPAAATPRAVREMVEGRAVDAAGGPIEGAAIYVMRGTTDSRAGFDGVLEDLNAPIARTDRDGSFRFSRAELRTFDRLVAFSPQHAITGVSGSFALHTARTGTLSLTLAPAATIAGTLVDQYGAPTPACIELRRSGDEGPGVQRVFADDEGRFRAERLMAGEHEARIVAAGCEEQLVALFAAQQPDEERIVLRRSAAAVHGRVTGSDGLPLPAPRLDAHTAAARAFVPARDVAVAQFPADPFALPLESSANGRRFCQVDPASGRFSVTLDAQQREAWIALIVCGELRRDSVVRVTASSAPLAFLVDEASVRARIAAVRVVARDARDGSELSNATVRFPTPGLPGYGLRDASGEYGPFLAGERELRVLAPGYRDATLPLELLAGSAGNVLEIALEPIP